MSNCVEIQLSFPCENPVDNVRATYRRRGKEYLVHIEVPINLPNIDTLGVTELYKLAKRNLEVDLKLLTDYNNKPLH